jgi:hypothetical protein
MSKITVDIPEDTLEVLKESPKQRAILSRWPRLPHSSGWGASPRRQPLSVQA